MNYGIPYMGSKSKIVHLIRYILERHYDKKYFIDVFTGGFAVSHYVMLNSNLKVLANDKNKYVVAFLEKLIKNELPKEVYNFVDRERFFDVYNNPEKYDDWYVGYVSTIYSFGNKQSTYMFGKDKEPYKHKMHEALVNNVWSKDIEFLRELIPHHLLNVDYKENKGKRLELLGIIKKHISKKDGEYERVQQLERLERAQQLEGLQRLGRLEQLERLDWRIFIDSIPIDILKNAIIYCDPPYEDTSTYAVDDFNHQEFWQWFRDSPYCVYVSSYKAPDDIKPLNFEYKNQLLSGGVGKKVKENIYWNGKGNPTPTMEDLLFGL